MGETSLKRWYVTGLHAYRSASEQASKAATEAGGLFKHTDLIAAAEAGVALAGRQQEILAGFLVDLGDRPNDYVDRIQEGVNKGTHAAVKAAPDEDARDVALQFGSRAAITYFVMAFDNHAIYAEALGLAEQADTFRKLSAENKALDDRYAELGRRELTRIAI